MVTAKENPKKGVVVKGKRKMPVKKLLLVLGQKEKEKKERGEKMGYCRKKNIPIIKGTVGLLCKGIGKTLCDISPQCRWVRTRSKSKNKKRGNRRR